MKIILLRHGKPTTPPLNKITASEFFEWVQAYNSAELCSSSQPTTKAMSQAIDCNALVCSGLRRSIESANKLNADHIVLSDPVFNEAELPVANWRTLKLSPKLWAFIFRILWLLGYSRNSESFKEAKTRAVDAVARLTELAYKHQDLMFVGHGVYNQILANELIRSGWVGPKRPGSKHWSFAIYERNNT